jgi:hypothetical protein
MPVVVGAGQRLFHDIAPSSARLTLTDARALRGGSAILTYVPEHSGGEG